MDCGHQLLCSTIQIVRSRYQRNEFAFDVCVLLEPDDKGAGDLLAFLALKKLANVLVSMELEDAILSEQAKDTSLIRSLLEDALYLRDSAQLSWKPIREFDLGVLKESSQCEASEAELVKRIPVVIGIPAEDDKTLLHVEYAADLLNACNGCSSIYEILQLFPELMHMRILRLLDHFIEWKMVKVLPPISIDAVYRRAGSSQEPALSVFQKILQSFDGEKNLRFILRKNWRLLHENNIDVYRELQSSLAEGILVYSHEIA